MDLNVVHDLFHVSPAPRLACLTQFNEAKHGLERLLGDAFKDHLVHFKAILKNGHKSSAAAPRTFSKAVRAHKHTKVFLIYCPLRGPLEYITFQSLLNMALVNFRLDGIC